MGLLDMLSEECVIIASGFQHADLIKWSYVSTVPYYHLFSHTWHSVWTSVANQTRIWAIHWSGEPSLMTTTLNLTDQLRRFIVSSAHSLRFYNMKTAMRWFQYFSRWVTGTNPCWPVFSSIAFTLPKKKSIAFENILVSECVMCIPKDFTARCRPGTSNLAVSVNEKSERDVRVKAGRNRVIHQPSSSESPTITNRAPAVKLISSSISAS